MLNIVLQCNKTLRESREHMFHSFSFPFPGVSFFGEISMSQDIPLPEAARENKKKAWYILKVISKMCSSFFTLETFWMIDKSDIETITMVSSEV